MAVGLVLTGAITLAKGVLHSWLTVGIAVGVVAIMLGTRINPAFLVLGSALIGLFAFRSS